MGDIATVKHPVRWPYLVICMIMFLFTGVVYAWSLFAGPLEAQFGWTRNETSVVYTMCMVLFNAANIVAGMVTKRFGVKANVFISAVFMGVGFIGSSMATEVWHLYIFYGIFVGLGAGFTYGSSISNIISWFPDKPGTASGVLLLAFGMATMITGTQVVRLFDVIGISNTFLALGIAAMVIIATVGFIIKPPPKDAVFPQAKVRKGMSDEPQREFTTKQMLGHPSYWFFMLWQVGFIITGMAVIGQAATSAASIGATALVATLATSALSICNGLARFFWGTMCDVLGIVKVRYMLNICMVLALAVCLGAIYIANPILLAVGFALIGVSYGGAIAYSAPHFRKVYGGKNYATNYSTFFVSGFLTPAIGAPVMSAVYTATGGYFLAFLAIAGFAVFGIVCSFFIRK